MIHNIKVFVMLAVLTLLTACSNDFLNDNLSSVTKPIAQSSIYLSPDWQSQNYQFKLPELKEAKYEITAKPSWLVIDSVSGHLTDSIATIQCSATKTTKFSEVGVYLDFMTVMVAGISYKVPVGYIVEGNPKLALLSNVDLSYASYGNPVVQIRNEGRGILMWSVRSLPDWLVVDTAKLAFTGMYVSQYSAYDIPLKFVNIENITGNLTGKMVIMTNDKEKARVEVNVTANFGTPSLNIYTNSIVYTSAETEKYISFSNYGNGILVWKFEDIPDWLTITPASGVSSSHSTYDNIKFSCNRSKLMPGQNTAYVKLKTNDNYHLSHTITVTAVAPGNNNNIRSVEGNIIDVAFDNNSSILYYVTSAPNKLIVYDVHKKSQLNEVSLSKAPTCLAISEDGTKAAVGQNGTISGVDLLNNTVKVYAVDYSVHDIAWAENDWFCFTQKGGSFSCLHWINTADGSVFDDSDKYSLDGSSIVKKVPSQPYLIATRNSSSPSGFFAFDIVAKSKKSYSHMDLTRFWMSEDGAYVFAGNTNVYRTSSSTGSTDTFDADINSIAKINFNGESGYGITFIHHSSPYMWIVANSNYSSSTATSIFKFEDNDYTMLKKIDYDRLYQPDTESSAIDISANYVFPNKEGTEIMALCKSLSNNTWVIQFVSVK